MNRITCLFSRRLGVRKAALTLAKLIAILVMLAPTTLGAASQGEPGDPAAPDAWDIHVVDGPAHFAMMTDRYLRLNSAGDPCLAYGGDHLYISCYSSVTSLWTSEIVDYSYMVGSHAALAFNNNNAPFISYFDAYNGDLKLAYKIGGIWFIKIMDESVLRAQQAPLESILDSSLTDFLRQGGFASPDPLGAPGINLPDFREYPKGIGKYTSIAIDSYGYVHISYYDDYNEADGKGRLKYAFWKGIGAVQTEIVDEYHDQGDVGLWTSIDLDGQDRPHIAYMSEKYDDLKYARKRGATWDIFTIDSSHNVGPSASMALDPYGRPHFSYMDFSNYSLRYARLNTDNSVTKIIVDSSSYVGLYSSIALDVSSGRIHISYYDLLNGDLRYARSNDTGFDKGIIASEGNIGGYTSLVVKAGKPRIAFFSFSKGCLYYSSFNGVTWSHTALTHFMSGDVGVATSLALSSTGVPHISYGDELRDYLKYAHAVGINWNLQFVTKDVSAGSYSSIKMLNDFQPVIAFYDYTHGNLVLAVWNTMYWVFQTIDSVDDVGEHVSLALDSHGYPHMSYYDATHGDLKYAFWNGAAWDIETLDYSGTVGLFTSLALDLNDRPYISYYHLNGEMVKLAMKTPIDSWVFEVVDSVGIPNDGIQIYEAYTSIGLDTSGFDPLPHIAYYNDTTKDLRYAYFDGTIWHYSTLDGPDDVGKFASLAIAPATLERHICYYDETNGDLLYLYGDIPTDTWAPPEVVDALGDVGMFCSIALDPLGRIGISYYDNSLGDLKYATNISPLPPALIFIPIVMKP